MNININDNTSAGKAGLTGSGSSTKWDEIKLQFPIFSTNPGLIYLDSAATAQKPRQVIDAIVDFYTRINSNVHRGIYKLSEAATEAYEAARKKVASFLNVNSQEIVFTSGTTYASNLLAYSWGGRFLGEGDIVVTTNSEHHSNFLSWQKIAAEKKAQINFVATTAEFDFDYHLFEETLQKGGKTVKVIVLGMVSNVLGYSLNLERIAAIRRTYAPQAILILDLAQAIAHTQIDLQASEADFAYLSGHKLFAETGSGVLWGKRDLLENIDPLFWGGGMISTVDRDNMSAGEVPEKFEAGTPNVAGAISIGSAIDFIGQIGMGNIQTYLLSLSAKLRQELVNIPQIQIYAPQQIQSPLISFNISGIHPHDVAAFLDQKNIAVRAGHHCTQILHKELIGKNGSVRVSLQIYNNHRDIEILVQALKECIDYFKK